LYLMAPIVVRFKASISDVNFRKIAFTFLIMTINNLQVLPYHFLLV